MVIKGKTDELEAFSVMLSLSLLLAVLGVFVFLKKKIYIFKLFCGENDFILIFGVTLFFSFLKGWD